MFTELKKKKKGFFVISEDVVSFSVTNSLYLYTNEDKMFT